MKKVVLILVLLPLFGSAQTASEIYLYNLYSTKGQLSLSSAKNISNHPGYDNQPSFHRKRPIIYYASFDENGRSDIKQYNYTSGETNNLTTTAEKEYSPTLTPDAKYISCILQRDNGKQDLVKYPVGGGSPVILIDDLTVGYHVWINKNEVLIFVLEGQSGNSLRRYNIATKKNSVIARNIGRSLHRIPGTDTWSFIDKVADGNWKINSYNPADGMIKQMAPTLSGREDLTWTKDGRIITSDGQKLYWLKPGSGASWTEIKVESTLPLNGITRLSIDAKNRKLAVVGSE